jgi:hypothetical protein
VRKILNTIYRLGMNVPNIRFLNRNQIIAITMTVLVAVMSLRDKV